MAFIEKQVEQLPPESSLAEKEKVKEEVALEAREQAEEEGLPVVKGKPDLAKIIQDENGGEQRVEEPKQDEQVKPTTGWRSWFKARSSNTGTIVRGAAGGTGKSASAALHFGKLGAQSAGTASAVLGVAGLVGAVFQAIAAGFDMRSAHSSINKARSLKAVLSKAKNDGVSPDIIEAVSKAMKTKYKKAWYKATTAALNLAGVVLTTTLLAVGGVALLASNPIGWAIAGALTLAGLAFFAYRVIRWFKKGAKRGQGRQKTAETLFNALIGADKHADQATASNAIKELGLKGEAWLEMWNKNNDKKSRQQLKNVAVGELMRKLKWS